MKGTGWIDQPRGDEGAPSDYLSLFFTLFEDSPDGVLILGLDDAIILEANPAFLQMIGRRRDEVIGRTSPELDMWVDLKERETLLTRPQSGHPVARTPVQIRDTSRIPRSVELSCHFAQFMGRRSFVAIFREVSPTG